MKDFQWKIIHRIIYTEQRLQVMNRSNGICHLCNIETETLPHLFFKCNYTTQLLDLIQNTLYNNTIFDLTTPLNTINEEIMMFGDVSVNLTTAPFNTIITTTKWVIWKVRNIKKFQNKSTTPTSALIIIRRILKENIYLHLKVTPGTKNLSVISKYKALFQEL